MKLYTHPILFYINCFLFFVFFFRILADIPGVWKHCSTSYYNDPLHFHAQPNLPINILFIIIIIFFKEAL